MKLIKKGFNYSQDGPGNRLVYHLQGCNMKCPWCANPESIPPEGVLMTDKQNLLDEVCPYGAIKEQELDRERCRSCTERVCLKTRRNKGIFMSYFEADSAEILAEVLKAKGIFFDGGGVTFSGGEPTLQFAELKDILVKLHEHNIHTVIETNGTHPRLEELFPYIDLLIMDLKQIDEEKHRETVGVSNQQVKRNIEKAMNNHPNVLFRTPLIHGFNDQETHIHELINFYRRFNHTTTRFEFLKYHEFGKAKWEQCGFTYQMKDGFVTDQIQQQYETEFERNGFHVVRT